MLEHVGNIRENNWNTRTVCFNFRWLVWGICYVKKALIWCKDFSFLKNHFAIPLNQRFSFLRLFFGFYWRPLNWWSETLPLISPSSKICQVSFIPFVSFLSFQLWFLVLCPTIGLKKAEGKTNTKGVKIFPLLFCWCDSTHCLLAFRRVWQLQIVWLGSW